MGSRWYDSTLERFTQQDLSVPGAGNPIAFAKFKYQYYNFSCYEINKDSELQINLMVDVGLVAEGELK